MKKRLLSLCLTAALCLTLLPTAAWAEEADPPDGQVVEASSSDDTEKQDAATEADEPEDTAPAMQETPAPTAAQSAENVAEVTSGGATTQYADLPAALAAAENGATVTLLANAAVGNVYLRDKTVTLDLNGKTVKNSGGGSKLIEIGSSNSSAKLIITGRGSFTSADQTLVVKNGTLDLSRWTGDNSYIYRVTLSGANSRLISPTGAGKIDRLAFIDSDTEQAADTASLNGGRYDVIVYRRDKTINLGDLLAEGYAFRQNGTFLEYARELKNNDTVEEVEVVKCPHPNMEPDAATGIATCEYCGGKFVASVDGNLYTDMKEAISYWLENGGTLKLYTDYTATDDGTWRIGSGSHTVNLNGHRMSVQNDGAFKPTNNMHLTVTDGTERGQIENILLDGSQDGNFTLESGYVGNLKMTGGAVVALKGGSVDNLDVQNCSANTNLSIQGGSIGKLNIKDWADGMHVSATSGSLGAYTLPSGKILADVLDHQYYATGTSLDKRVDAVAQKWEKFDIKQAPYDFGSTSKTAEVPINGSIPFRVDSPSENVGVYDVKWYRRTNNGAEHMTENKVAGVEVGDTLDVLCVITGLDQPNNGTVLWQVAVKGYTLKTLPPSLENAEIIFTDGWQERTFWPDSNNQSVGGAEISSELGAYTVKLNGTTLKEGTDYTVSGNVATRIGTYDLTITGKTPNYSGTKTAQWTVIPYTLHEPSFLGKQTYTKIYDGTTTLPEYTFRALFPGRGSDWEVDWREDKYKNNYEVTAAEFVSADAGENKPINQTITLKNENFVFAPTEKINIKGITTTDKTITYTNFTPIETYPTLETTFNIEKAPMPDFDKEVTLDIVNDLAHTYTIDLLALPPLESPRTYGEIEYSQPTVQLDTGYYTDGNAKVENGKLILTIDKNPVTTTGPIGTVTVQVTSTNYEDVTLTVNLNAVNKQRLGMFVSVATDPIVYGMTLGDIKLSAEATVGDQVIPGTIAWEDPLTTLPAAGRATYRWTFTPDDTMHYLTASNTINFLVDKATPTGAPTYAAITTGGKTLADAPLTPNAGWPSGTVQWVDKDGKPLPAATQVQANTEYTWSFTPADAANYNGATGSVTLYAVTSGGGSSSGGGGSSSASKTTTTTNADGSVTKTETKADGTVIAATTAKDGSVTRIETKPDGSSVTQRTLADGSTGTVKTAADGTTRVEASISAQAVESAKKSGSAVQVPTQVRAGQRSDSAPTVRIELPKNAGETKLEIPVENVNSGTVAVIVHEDGTEELVTDSLPTETGVQLTVDGSATVKLLQNAKSFADTKDHWAKDAIDFVSARGLVSGMGGTTYAPDASTTRAQLWTILARRSGADLTGGATWYEKAQAWSKASGVSDGSDPNAAISRAQVVTMLWRAAGSPAAQSGTAFHDVAADSYYGDAVDWAVAHGITSGVGSGRFDPNGTCTRAQLAAFLMRSYQNQ